MKKFISIITAFLIMIPTVVSASVEIMLDKETDKINVSGESEKNNVSLMLLNPEFTLYDTEDATLSEAVLFYRPVDVNEGEYSYSIKMPSGTERGIYTLYADSESKVIYYASAAERLSMIGEIKTAIEENTLSDYLYDNGAYLCDAEKFLSVSDTADVADMAGSLLSEEELVEGSPESLGKISEALDFSVVVGLLNERNVEELSEISKIVDESKMDLKFSQKSLIPVGKQFDIVERISGKDINSVDGFYNALQESIFIGVINESKTLSANERKEFFEEYAEVANLDIADYNKLTDKKKSSVVAQLASAKKTTIADMQEKLDQLYEKEKPSEGGGSGGSGGGGGSSSHISAGGMGGATVAPPSNVTENTTKSFKDMASHKWAEEAVNALSDKGIITGYEDKTFKPSGSVTRAEFIQMIAKAFLPAYSGDSKDFADVAVNDWYYKSIMTALENKIVSGVGEGIFLPNEKIRRCDMAVILNNLINYKKLALSGGKLNFGDIDSIPSYAVDAVNVLNKNGVINGDENNNFRPEAFANRAEAAVMLYRFINLTEGEVNK